MKCFMGWLLALVMVTAALAGEDPYVAVVGNDIDANPFYFSPKHSQFRLDQTAIGVPTTFEAFRSQFPAIQPEVCDTLRNHTSFGNPNARVTAGNKGWFDWLIRLPKKPSGEINICIECGVLKPNAQALGSDAIELCAAETGERVGPGVCSRTFVGRGVNPIVPEALPRLLAIAFHGENNRFDAFYLTAYKNPGSYEIPFSLRNDQLGTGGETQLLDGSLYSRILLKACMDKCITVKVPTEGEVNAGNPPLPRAPGFPPLPPGTIDRLGAIESNLVAGDFIYVRLIVPSANSVDIYCHAQSARLAGVGESP